MSVLFDDNEDEMTTNEFDSEEPIPVARSSQAAALAARKRLEKILEDKRVRLELDDFDDLE